jgi:hypothetical protein
MSVDGPPRHFASAQQLRRFRSEADISLQVKSADSVENDPFAESAEESKPSRGRLEYLRVL